MKVRLNAVCKNANTYFAVQKGTATAATLQSTPHTTSPISNTNPDTLYLIGLSVATMASFFAISKLSGKQAPNPASGTNLPAVINKVRANTNAQALPKERQRIVDQIRELKGVLNYSTTSPQSAGEMGRPENIAMLNKKISKLQSTLAGIMV